MNTKKTAILLGLAVIVIAGGIAVAGRIGSRSAYTTPSSETSAVSDVGASNASSTPTSAPKTTTYTLADVAKHNNASSCWTSINGGVYDVTSWINQHPGGPEAILGICGIDGSAAFNAQHGGQRRPAQELAGFKIGALAQ